MTHYLQTMTTDHNKAARELLTFYAEAGVDTPVGEAATDWLTAPLPSVQPTAKPSQPAAPAFGSGVPTRTADLRKVAPRATPPPPAPDAAVMAAREAARSAASLD